MAKPRSSCVDRSEKPLISPNAVTSTAQTGTPRPRFSRTESEALERYQLGVEALQRHRYREAADYFRGVLEDFPDEKELHDRARLYMNICERQDEAPESTPRTIEERVYAATLALNAGAYDEALRHLRLVVSEDGENDSALYMLAVIGAQQGDPVAALSHLKRAIELNPANRALARHDPDLIALRDLSGFRDAVNGGAISRRGRSRRGRARH